MSAQITIKETIPVSGICPMDGEYTKIDVTYKKHHPLGSKRAYAVVTDINCIYVHNGCTVEQCPIAYSRIYW